MRTIFFLLIVITMACQQAPKTKKASKEKQVATRYQVQQGSQFVGYADKRVWENEQGVAREDYFVYTPERSLVGHISWHGDVKKFNNNGDTEPLGTFNITTGISKILNVENASIYPVRMENVIVAENKSIVIENKGKSSEGSEESSESTEESSEEIPEDIPEEEEPIEEESTEDSGESEEPEDGELEDHPDESEPWEEE